LELVTVASGFEALRQLLTRDFALILMDVNMPGMDGFEAAELIRQRRRCAHTPIIFLTASERAEAQIFRGYALGAVDYLVKPIVPQVLRSKVAVFADIFRQAEQIQRQGEMLRRLEQREHERRLAEAKARWEAERLQTELRLAREVQQRLFPATTLPVPGLDIAGGSFPAEATGGDYFDYIPMQDGALAVAIGDVCGHGLGPALLMAELRAYLRALLLTRTDVGEIVEILNRAITGDTDRFVTFLMARVDTCTRSLEYAGAGHMPGYVFDVQGDVKARLLSTGLPLGVLAESIYPVQSVPPLQDGEVVLLLTDGIVEARGEHGTMFGTERAVAVVQSMRNRPSREIVNALFHEVRDFSREAVQPDDMTAVVIRAVATG
jgi:phosphoserine phosphatase RsbU/P